MTPPPSPSRSRADGLADPDPQPAGQQAVLDAQALAALAQLDPNGSSQLVQRVLTTYRQSLARLLVQLAQGRTNGDVAALRLVTHTLKSSSASVGALALSSICGAAEQAVRDGRLETLPALLDELEAEAVRVDAAVLQLLPDPGTSPR